MESLVAFRAQTVTFAVFAAALAFLHAKLSALNVLQDVKQMNGHPKYPTGFLLTKIFFPNFTFLNEPKNDKFHDLNMEIKKIQIWNFLKKGFETAQKSFVSLLH